MPKPLRRCEAHRAPNDPRGGFCNRALPPTARADARFCSPACRARERRFRPRMDRVYARSAFFGGTDRQCQHCGERIMVCGLDERREDARYCSARCRVAAYRAREKMR